MTTKLLVLYNHPADPAAFDHYYATTHAPLARAVPGLRSLLVSAGPIGTPAGPAPYHRIAELSFDSLADLQSGLASPEGQAAAGDLANFAGAGATLLIYEMREA